MNARLEKRPTALRPASEVLISLLLHESLGFGLARIRGLHPSGALPSGTLRGLIWISYGFDLDLIWASPIPPLRVSYGFHMDLIWDSFFRVSEDERAGYPMEGGP